MNYVKQAFGISEEKMGLATRLYKESVAQLVFRDYVGRVDNALIELSAIFGNKWLQTQRCTDSFWHEANLYSEAKIAFNYANLAIGMRGQFIALAKELVADDFRISNERLEEMSMQLEEILTYARVKKIFQSSGNQFQSTTLQLSQL